MKTRLFAVTRSFQGLMLVKMLLNFLRRGRWYVACPPRFSTSMLVKVEIFARNKREATEKLAALKENAKMLVPGYSVNCNPPRAMVGVALRNFGNWCIQSGYSRLTRNPVHDLVLRFDWDEMGLSGFEKKFSSATL